MSMTVAQLRAYLSDKPADYEVLLGGDNVWTAAPIHHCQTATSFGTFGGYIVLMTSENVILQPSDISCQSAHTF